MSVFKVVYKFLSHIYTAKKTKNPDNLGTVRTTETTCESLLLNKMRGQGQMKMYLF